MSAAAGMEDGESSWRRAALTYQEKFVNDYVIHVPDTAPDAPPLRIAQAPSASAAKDILVERGGAVGTTTASRGGGGEGGGEGDGDDAGDDDGAEGDEAKDPIPATAYTIWDAGILLGNYVTQKEVWRRLVDNGGGGGGGNESGNSDDDKVVVLELGAGTGVAGLTVAACGLAKVVAMSDLPEVIPFLRHNAGRNKHPAGPIQRTTAMAVVPLR